MEELPPIELAGSDAPARPKLPGGVVMREDRDSVYDALLADLYLHARNCIRTFGDFHLAAHFSPEMMPFIRRMMTDPFYREFPWSRTRVWLVDEVAVGEDDARCRGSLMDGLVVEGSGMPREQAHRIDMSRVDAAEHYEGLLKEHLGWREKGQDRLDVVLVPQHADGSWGGICDDALNFGEETDASLMVAIGETDESPARVCMRMRLARSARLLAIVATGKDAAKGVNVWRGKFSVGTSGALPTSDAAEVRWYVDYEACG
jgi:6-phosphogluconolactonase/glucosamine-6-phosphate isomerase/deaminase